MRASDAHSWVEVYFPTYGWLTFDPTPPGDDKPLGWFARIGHYLDWFELQWSEWVVNYDFVHQFALAQNMGRVSRDWTERLRIAFTKSRQRATNYLELWQSRILSTPAAIPGAVATFALLAAFILSLQPNVRKRIVELWHLRVASAGAMTPHLATIQYNEMLRLLARRGIRKAPAQTPVEFAASLPNSNLAVPVLELTTMYQASRFGGQTPDARMASSILDQIQSFLRSQGAR